MQKLEQYSTIMDSQYREIRPLFDSLDEKISTSEFYDIIECKALIWKINENFKKNNSEFYEVVKNAEDSELVFDKIECKKKLAEYLNTQLCVKRHLLEVIELKEKTLVYY